MHFTWILVSSVLTPHPHIRIVGIEVSIPVAAAAVQKCLLSSKTVQMSQKDWTTSSNKCATADVGVCNWMGINRGYIYSFMFLVITSDWDFYYVAKDLCSLIWLPTIFVTYSLLPYSIMKVGEEINRFWLQLQYPLINKYNYKISWWFKSLTDKAVKTWAISLTRVLVSKLFAHHGGFSRVP